MGDLCEIKDLKFLLRDARNVRNVDAITLIGLKISGVSNLDCGACEFGTCKEMLEHGKVQKEFLGSRCMIKYLDLGIVVGSAAAKAKDLCIERAFFIPQVQRPLLQSDICGWGYGASAERYRK